MYKGDLTLTNQQLLICHKNQTNLFLCCPLYTFGHFLGYSYYQVNNFFFSSEGCFM